MIKTWQQRCEEHPDHEGIVSEQMIRDRMQEEIDELRQALAEEALDRMVAENQRLGLYDDNVDITEERVHKSDKSIPEPVCFLRETSWSYEIAPWDDPNGIPVYAAPPKKEWVGLTTAEIIQCQAAYYYDTYANIEAKLKEKNT